jgi:tetratricopeptide (TPR) repeat protein
MHRIFSPVRAALFVALCVAATAAEAALSTPFSTPEEARAVAAQLAEAGNQPAAIAILQDELAKHPADTATRLQLARQLALSKRYTEATEQYSAVLAREPQNLTAKLGLAKVASWQGDLERGLALYEDVLARSPHLYDARVGKGFTLAWMGRNDEALTILRSATKVHPEDLEVAHEVARLELLVRSSVPAPTAGVITARKTQPRRGSAMPSAAPAAVPATPSADYPRTFAEPISPAQALAPEPRPWIPIAAFISVVLALAGVTFVVRKRVHPVAVALTVSPVVAAEQPLADRSAATSAPLAPAQSAAKRVLLLEPNDDAAEFVRMFLEHQQAQQQAVVVSRCATADDVVAEIRHAALVLIGEACAPARIVELVRAAEVAGCTLAFACGSREEAQEVHAAGGQSIRRPFRIMDLHALLVTQATPETPLDAHTWKTPQADAASCARPFHSPPRPLQ